MRFVRRTKDNFEELVDLSILVSPQYPDDNIQLFNKCNTNPDNGIVFKNKVKDRELVHAIISTVKISSLYSFNSYINSCSEVKSLVNENITFNKMSLGRTVTANRNEIGLIYKLLSGVYYTTTTEVSHNNALTPLTINYWCKYTTISAGQYDIWIAEPIVNINSSSYYDGNGKLKVTWKFSTDERIFEQFTQKSAELYYKKSSDSSYTKVGLNDNFYNFNSLENTQYDFYVKVVTDDNQIATSSVITTTNEDVVGSAVALSPSNTVETGSVLFKWQYKNDYDSPQYAFDIATSEDSNEWKVIANHIESIETQCLMDVYNKNVYWKVRSYNLNDKPSEWSNILYFVNNAKQQPPINITVEQSGRPLIEWECDGQIAYELETEGYKSGVIYSENRYHFLNEYLGNGTHSIRIRCYNSYGNKSEWSEFEYVQNMTVEKQPNVMVEKLLYGIKITIQSDPLFTKYYVYRNGVCISKINNEIIDYFVQGECNYTIRGITVNDLFADSEVSVNYDFKGAQLITLDKVVIDVDKRLDSKPTRKVNVNIDCESKAYLGKKKLVHSFGTLVQRAFNVTCQSNYVPLGIICFYRDEHQSAFVICNSNSVEYFDYGNEAQFTLEETDFNEVIEYDI
ncbi:hypothetical protein [Anaerorhabdus sp.]|uniref:hypothetical protein n=1 Tax=Anaerorhabdus sp. TaxID=1872524 RepID=UPI002FC8BC28